MFFFFFLIFRCDNTRLNEVNRDSQQKQRFGVLDDMFRPPRPSSGNTLYVRNATEKAMSLK